MANQSTLQSDEDQIPTWALTEEGVVIAYEVHLMGPEKLLFLLQKAASRNAYAAEVARKLEKEYKEFMRQSIPAAERAGEQQARKEIRRQLLPIAVVAVLVFLALGGVWWFWT